MKLILSSMVLTIYLAVCSGFVVNMHYCMNRLDSISFGSTEEDACGKCGMNKDGKCCEDEVMVVKLETLHRATPAIQHFFSPPAEEMILTRFLVSPYRNFVNHLRSEENGPPLHKQDTYLQISVFRI